GLHPRRGEEARLRGADPRTQGVCAAITEAATSRPRRTFPPRADSEGVLRTAGMGGIFAHTPYRQPPAAERRFPPPPPSPRNEATVGRPRDIGCQRDPRASVTRAWGDPASVWPRRVLATGSPRLGRLPRLLRHI